MKNLLYFYEFGSKDSPSIKTIFSDAPSPYKDKIIQYLRHGKVELVSAGFTFDYFTGERLDDKDEIMTDGEYVWNTALIYYVDRYNAQLPEEFVNKIIGKA